MSVGKLETDGSSELDSRAMVEIDRSVPHVRWRYLCPNGHSGRSWDATNSHIWCSKCRRLYEAGRDVDAEHYHLVDKKTGEEIPFASVRLVE